MLVWFIILIQGRWEQESPWDSLASQFQTSVRPCLPPPCHTHTHTHSIVHLWTDTWGCPLATTQMHMGTPPHISTHPRPNKSDCNCSFVRRRLVFIWTNFHSLGTLVHVHTDGSFCQYVLMDVKNFLVVPLINTQSWACLRLSIRTLRPPKASEDPITLQMSNSRGSFSASW